MARATTLRPGTAPASQSARAGAAGRIQAAVARRSFERTSARPRKTGEDEAGAAPNGPETGVGGPGLDTAIEGQARALRARRP